LLAYQQTPEQEIRTTLLHEARVRLSIKREDMNHPNISGNKWWKLKYNLREATRLKKDTILTFGGAYSNHIYATAAAAHEVGLESIGIIRGDEVLPLNETLQFAKSCGMQLRYVSREKYREKNESYFIETLRGQFGDFYLLPEGGSNEFAVQGVAEFTETFKTPYDYLCCSVGTGGTMAGLVRGLSGSKKIIGFSAIRGSEYLYDEVRKLEGRYANWEINGEYHYGGYAKATPDLLHFMEEFERVTGIPLDRIYTGKMMAGIFDLVRRNAFPAGATILAIHTGGLRNPPVNV
jgi:1-aminocyclopropane-1-carboxylate deaminase